MILLPDGRILLSGGAMVDEKCVPSYHNDLRQLDTETMLWSKAKSNGGFICSSPIHLYMRFVSISACDPLVVFHWLSST